MIYTTYKRVKFIGGMLDGQTRRVPYNDTVYRNPVGAGLDGKGTAAQPLPVSETYRQVSKSQPCLFRSDAITEDNTDAR